MQIFQVSSLSNCALLCGWSEKNSSALRIFCIRREDIEKWRIRVEKKISWNLHGNRKFTNVYPIFQYTFYFPSSGHNNKFNWNWLELQDIFFSYTSSPSFSTCMFVIDFFLDRTLAICKNSPFLPIILFQWSFSFSGEFQFF